MKKLNTKTVIATIAALAAATTAYKMKKIGPCSYELDDRAREENKEKTNNKDTNIKQ